MVDCRQNRKEKMSKEYYYTKNKDGFMGSENRKVRKKKSETCEEQLRRMVRNVADEITEGKEDPSRWLERCGYDIRYLVDSSKRFLGSEIMVAGGGPTIWVDTFREQVTGWWGTDRVQWYFQDNMGLNDYMEEMYGC